MLHAILTGLRNIERFSIDCRETKTKLITVANHKRRDHAMNHQNS